MRKLKRSLRSLLRTELRLYPIARGRDEDADVVDGNAHVVAGHDGNQPAIPLAFTGGLPLESRFLEDIETQLVNTSRK